MSERPDQRDRILRRGVSAAAVMILVLACAGLIRELTRPPAVATVVRGAAPIAAEHRIDINTAPAHLLQTLPGVGPKLAERIIESRTSNGPFASVEDLQRVKGIGPRTVARLAEVTYASGGAPDPER